MHFRNLRTDANQFLHESTQRLAVRKAVRFPASAGDLPIEAKVNAH